MTFDQQLPTIIGNSRSDSSSSIGNNENAIMLDTNTTSSPTSITSTASNDDAAVKKEENKTMISSGSDDDDDEYHEYNPTPPSFREDEMERIPTSVREMAFGFGYDSDESPPPEEEELYQRLDWRMDPSESLSDWEIIIEIINDDDGNADDNDQDTSTTSSSSSSKTYHVHRNVLAVGARRSDYFARLFQQTTSGSGNFLESKSNKSIIRLHQIAASAFPILLDYMYYPERKLQIVENNATSLHYLGEYFAMRLLRYDAKQFYMKSINLRNCYTYYEHALLLHDEKVKHAVAKLLLCSENIGKLTKESKILTLPDPYLWIEVLTNTDKSNVEDNLHTSIIISEFCKLNQNSITKDEFKQLTTEELLPNVHVDAALIFIEVENAIAKRATESNGDCEGNEIVAVNVHQSHLHEDNDNDSSGDNGNDLSNLQRRCVKSLTYDWRNLKFDKNVMKFLKKQNPELLVELYQGAIENAQEQIETLHQNQQQLENNLTTLTNQHTTIVNENTKLKETCNRLKIEMNQFYPVEESCATLVGYTHRQLPVIIDTPTAGLPYDIQRYYDNVNAANDDAAAAAAVTAGTNAAITTNNGSSNTERRGSGTLHSNENRMVTVQRGVKHCALFYYNPK